VFTFSFPIFSFFTIIPKNIFNFTGSYAGTNGSRADPRFKMILWSLIAGTRGGVNRAKILNLVKDTPLNAHKISTLLELDHKTIVHHVVILSKNGLIFKESKEYGATYKLTSLMSDNQNVLDEIMERIGTK